MGFVRKALSGAALAYALYAGIGGAWACADWVARKDSLEHDAAMALIIQRFEVPRPQTSPIQLVVVGEKHVYTGLESRLAKELVANTDVVLTEGHDMGAELDVGDVAFALSIALQQTIAMECYGLGSGRGIGNPTIGNHSAEHRVPAVALENGTDGYIQGLPADVRAQLFVKFTAYALFCPETYRQTRNATIEFAGADENKVLENILEVSSDPLYADIVVKRDLVMAQAAADYLKNSPYTRVLLVSGSGHTPGIIRHLTALTNMRPLTPLQLATHDPIAQHVERNLSE